MPNSNLYALMVAINDYPDPAHVLEGGVNDLNRLKDHLVATLPEVQGTIRYRKSGHQVFGTDDRSAGKMPLASG